MWQKRRSLKKRTKTVTIRVRVRRTRQGQRRTRRGDGGGGERVRSGSRSGSESFRGSGRRTSKDAIVVEAEERVLLGSFYENRHLDAINGKKGGFFKG